MSFSPRQADVLICAGRLPFKLAPVIRRIWDQMPQPKWSISMGACASTGGIFDNYSMVQGIDTIIPVDVYVPGCPPAARRPDVRDPAPAEEDQGREHHRRRRSARRSWSVRPGSSCRRSGWTSCPSRSATRFTRPDPHDRSDSDGSRPERSEGPAPLRPECHEHCFPLRSPRSAPSSAPPIERHLVSCGDTIVYVSRDRSHDVLAWLKDTPGQELQLPHRRDGGGLSRSRAPARGGLPAPLARAAGRSPGQGRARQARAARGPLGGAISGAAPTGWSARCSTCSASSSPGTPTCAAS